MPILASGICFFLLLGVSCDVDVVIAVLPDERGVSNLGVLWYLFQSSDPQPLLHALKSKLPVSDVVGGVILFERDGVQLSLELQPTNLMSCLFQRRQ